MSEVRRLIVNADGFGCDVGLDDRALAAHTDGILTSVSLVVSGGAATRAAKLAGETAALGVGLHIALSGAQPLLPAFEIQSLVDDQGRFPAEPGGLSAARPDELLDEMRAQYRRFRQLLGRPPTHLDVKGDGHTQAAIFEALVTLAWETGLPVRGLDSAMRQRLRREALPTIDELLDPPAQGDVESVLRLIEGIKPGVTELRYRSCEVPQGPAEATRVQEWHALTDPRVKRAITTLGVRLIHFGQL
jgi:predicted glycoside hydrolase/deacetylase ChbG (UPF0249 family)